MKGKIIFSIVLLFFISTSSFAQKWAEDMQKPTGNFYDIQREFEEYWSTRDKDEKGKGYKVFKRWEHFVEPRVYPSGDLSLLNQTAANFEAFMNAQASTNPIGGKLLGANPNMIASSTFTPNGPFGALAGSAGSQFLKSGRLNFLTIDPTNTLNLWVGAPAGGLWKSTNGGTSWTTNTDNLTVIGCTDLAIDPTNTNIMYLATGDGFAGDTRSIGVLKSTNGGNTWSATGLTNQVTTNFLIRRLIINPSNTQILMAATNQGIFRTTNGGLNWTNVSTGSVFDLEFKPGDPNTVYASGTNFRVSTNAGANFTTITSGVPTSGVQRMAIAVTQNDANYVYLLAANSANSGFLGLYRSTNSGVSFAAMATSTPNLLGWSNAGTDTGGQGWYDLCVAASPLNKDEVVVGGVNVWRSLNGGSSWSIYGHWTGSGAPFTHADQHALMYAANGTLFVCNDGTVYRRNATAWQEISGTMNISQIYKIGLATQSANRWITGHQDNGTSIFTGTSYNAEIGGDGMDCFIDRTNNNNVFGSTQNGGHRRSTNAGANWSSCTTGLTGSAPWVSVWKQDPQTANTLYCGWQNLFKSNDLAATTWTMLTALPATGAIREFAIAPSNNQIIYVLKSNGIYKTTNGGTSWTTVTNGVPVGSGAPEFISIHPTNPNMAWVVLSGYSAGNKIFMTTNGGTSWTNYSANLPNIPANCCIYEPGSNNRIYVGMDVGIYFRDANSSTWTLYNTGLPNVPISDFETSPANPGILYASTYGRGVWSVGFYSPVGAPLSMFAAPAQGKCVAASMTFSDQSTNTPNAWNWSVIPSSGVVINSSTAQNPTITFPSPGNYTVTLQANNAIGQGTIHTQVVTISNPPVLSISVPSPSVCIGQSVTLTASGANTYSWSSGGGGLASANFYPSGVSVYTVSGTTNSCSTIKTATVTAMSLPIVSISGQNSSCSGSEVVLTGNGAATYTWSTMSAAPSISVNPLVTTNYSFTATGANGCSNVAFFVVGVNPLPILSIASSGELICDGEEVTLIGSGAVNYMWSPSGQVSNILVANPATTTTYTMSGVDANGCMNTAAMTVSVSTCESLFEQKLAGNSRFSVFPNPSKDKITVSSSDASVSDVNAEVFDLSGRVVLKSTLKLNESGENEINISALAAGQYLVKLNKSNGESEVLKIVKE